MGKIYTRFQTKKAHKPYPMGRTYPYGLYNEVPPRVTILLAVTVFTTLKRHVAIEDNREIMV